MSKNQIFRIVGLAAALAIGSFAAALAGGDSLPKADGAAVYEYITQTNPYQRWSFFPGTGEFYQGKHPHGALLTTYVNDLALTGIQGKVGTLRDGSIIVKENYLPDKKLGAVTVMYRVAGYDSEAGDWFWAKYKADGSLEKAGKVAGCIGCHAAVINNDWIFTGPVK
jgi:hypothetical protein